VEDGRFIVGAGRFVGDITLPNQCCGVLVVAPHAHALIRSIETSAAERAPGVVAIFTGADVAKDRLGGIPAYNYPEDWGGPKSFHTEWPLLARDRVRFVGDRVALVVAETLDEARDAAELVEVDYEPLDACTDLESATDSENKVWDSCDRNICFAMSLGDKEATDAAFSSAAHVVSTRVKNQRLSANPLETRSCLASYDPSEDRYTLFTSSQNPHGVRKVVAASVLGVPESAVRVVSPDVGGGFGAKANAYPEDALLLWAARKCGRPIRWVCDRGDALACDNHGRDQISYGELALDAEGRILALRGNAVHGLGAYFVSASASPVRTALRLATSVYHIPTVWLETRAVFTHGAPIGVYRGAGRPEANILIERLMDRAADALGLDPAEIRRRNLIPRAKMPYTTISGFTYDSGDFPGLLSSCLERSDWTRFEEQRADSARKGRLRGRAVSPYIESGGVANERMELKIDAEGRATIVSGTHAHGQGHATTYAQIVSDRLGAAVEDIRFVQGDTDRVSVGRGTYAARSSLVGGCALVEAIDAMLAKATRMAAVLLQSEVGQIEHDRGLFRVAGTNRSVSLRDVAKACHGMMLPPGMDLGLDGVGTYGAYPPNFPTGCHVCELEVDPETGEVGILKYIVIDDVGTVINPMICEGQVHGGLAQGIGQALFEEIVYAPNGQLVTGSFMDYAMPRASDLPSFDIAFQCTPAQTNLLGIKGVGEAGIVASPSVVSNAILDALRPLGVEDIDLPATPPRIMDAIWAAKRGTFGRTGTSI
jgi:carbon-monoxide dehydrogenase large subunit